MSLGLPRLPKQLELTLSPIEAQGEVDASSILRSPGSYGHKVLRGADGVLYYCKGPSLTPQYPFVGVNELLVNRLASLIEVPVRRCELITWQGQVLVGTEYLERKLTGTLESQWPRLRNMDELAYRLVVLDAWVLNEDRHGQNWLGMVLGDGTGEFIASDHDKALLSTYRQPADLDDCVGHPIDDTLVRLPILRAAIKEPQRLSAAITRIARLDNEVLARAVAVIPRPWLGLEEQAHVVDFLRLRRDTLTTLFASATVFPNLRRTGDTL